MMVGKCIKAGTCQREAAKVGKEKCDSKRFHRWQVAVGAKDEMEE